MNHKFWKMLFIVNVFADSVCVVFASPLTLLFALFCEHVSNTPEMFACSQIICDFRHAWQLWLAFQFNCRMPTWTYLLGVSLLLVLSYALKGFKSVF